MSSRVGHWIGCYSLLGLIATLACSSDVVGPSSPSSGPLTPTQDENGRIAFDSDRDGNLEIYVMNADGTGQTRLTNNSAFDLQPAWSPDGTKIAFQSTRDGNPEIYVMNADGTSINRLTFIAASDLDATWSPNGTRIAFESTRDGNFEIYVMNPDGTGVTRLTNDPAIDGAPAWSPNGTKIGFTRFGGGNTEVYVMNADGSGPTNLTNNLAIDSDPAWSPDGTKIAFRSSRDVPFNFEIYVMNADGTAPTNLTNNPAGDNDPSWGPAAAGPPQCSDGLDNDGDGLIDFPADPGCTSAADTTESPNPSPGSACPAPPPGNVLVGRSFFGVVLFLGTDGDDVAVGVPGRRNVFLMRGGNDTATGADLQDAFFGGEGDDTWCGGGGSDAAFGDRGSDNLTGSDGFDRNDGGHGGPPNSPDTDTDVCFGEANFLCEQSAPDGVVISSMRFKQDVRYLLPEGRSFLGLRPVAFRYQEPYRDPAIRRLGLIAEDVAWEYPEAIAYGGDGLPLGIRHGILSASFVDRIERAVAETVRGGVLRLAGRADAKL